MIVVPYNNNLNEFIEILLQSRDMDVTFASSLPECGVIIFNEDGPVAAGFMRSVEGNMGMLDSYITNSKSSKEDRIQAIDLVTRYLISRADRMKIVKLMAFTQYSALKDSMAKHGTISTNHMLFLRDVKCLG